jgi:hypothetical protein
MAIDTRNTGQVSHMERLQRPEARLVFERPTCVRLPDRYELFAVSKMFEFVIVLSSRCILIVAM